MAEATIGTVEATAYRIPTASPEADGTLAWDSTGLVVATVTAGDRTGMGFTYAAPAAARLIGERLSGSLAGRDPWDIPALAEAMARAVRNDGRPGVAATATPPNAKAALAKAAGAILPVVWARIVVLSSNVFDQVVPPLPPDSPCSACVQRRSIRCLLVFFEFSPPQFPIDARAGMPLSGGGDATAIAPRGWRARTGRPPPRAAGRGRFSPIHLGLLPRRPVLPPFRQGELPPPCERARTRY